MLRQTCWKCGLSKRPTDFAVYHPGTDRPSVCKDCHSAEAESELDRMRKRLAEIPVKKRSSQEYRRLKAKIEGTKMRRQSKRTRRAKLKRYARRYRRGNFYLLRSRSIVRNLCRAKVVTRPVVCEVCQAPTDPPMAKYFNVHRSTCFVWCCESCEPGLTTWELANVREWDILKWMLKKHGPDYPRYREMMGRRRFAYGHDPAKRRPRSPRTIAWESQLKQLDGNLLPEENRHD